MKNKIVAIVLSIALAMSLIIPSTIVMAEPGGGEEPIESIDDNNEGYYEEVNDDTQNVEEEEVIEESDDIFDTEEYDSTLVKILRLSLNKSEDENITYTDLEGIISIDIEELQKEYSELKDTYVVGFGLLKEMPNLEEVNLGNIKFDNLDIFNELTAIKKLKINGCTFNLPTEEPFKDILNNIQVIEEKVNEEVVNRKIEINLGDVTVDSSNMGFDIPQIYELTSIDNLSEEDKAKVLDYEIVDNSDWALNNYRIETNKSDFNIDEVNLKIKLTNSNIEKAIINIKVIIDESLKANNNEEISNGTENSEEVNPLPDQSKENTAPEIIVEDKVINIGDDFDRLEGITASDKEDGDLTSKIKVIEDNVNINVVGEYSITYNVEDSNGVVTTKIIKVIVIEDIDNPEENKLPVINVEDKTINIGDKFDPKADVTATDKDGNDITKNIEIVENTVDINTVGKYIVTYSVKDSSDLESRKTIYVTVKKDDEVINNSPIINADNKNIYVGDKFNPWDGVTATDEEEGDITSRIKILANTVDVNKAGIYIITYEVIDKDGASTRKTIEVSVVNKDEKPQKNEAPIINASNRTIKYGSKFDPLYGVTATDKEDGNITSKIVVEQNLVDCYTKGKYSVTYSVTDSNGVKTTKVINVEVKDKELPINNAPIIYAKNQYVTVGNEFNPYSIVSAYDYEDGWISGKILVIYNSVNINNVGVYKITYQVTDSLGYTSTKSIYVNVTSKNNTRPTIYANNVVIPLGNKFNPYAMVSAYDKEDGWISGKIVVEYNYVNVYKAGKYDVGYSVTDSGGMRASCIITITVKDSNNFNGNKEDKNSEPVIYANNISIPLNSKFNPLEWVAAIDNEDGDITNRIMVISNEVDTSKEGNYHVTYEIIDKNGSKVNKVIMVYVKKDEDIKIGNNPPEIYATDVILEKGSYYDPLDKVTALDEEDGNLTHKITVKSNNINVSKNGEYKVILEVTDSMGEVATKTINVTVEGGIDLSDNAMLIIFGSNIVLVVLMVAAVITVVVTKKKK